MSVRLPPHINYYYIGSYKGTEWFFENAKREKIAKEKDDSFMCLNFQNVYDMEGLLPPDGLHEFEAADESEIMQAEGTTDWMSTNNISSNSPANRKMVVAAIPIEGSNVVKVSLSDLFISHLATIDR